MGAWCGGRRGDDVAAWPRRGGLILIASRREYLAARRRRAGWSSCVISSPAHCRLWWIRLYAHSITVYALRKLGEILKGSKRADGGDAQRTRFSKSTESPPTLADLHIDKKISSLAQKIADLPEAKVAEIAAKMGRSGERAIWEQRCYNPPPREHVPGVDIAPMVPSQTRRENRKGGPPEATLT